MKTVSDHREEKAILGGDYLAYAKDQAEFNFAKAKTAYLQANPEVGVIMRNGIEIFYRNIEPYHLGKIEEFTPASVITIYGLWKNNHHYKDRISFPFEAFPEEI